jgi:hypothetical protein
VQFRRIAVDEVGLVARSGASPASVKVQNACDPALSSPLPIVTTTALSTEKSRASY